MGLHVPNRTDPWQPSIITLWALHNDNLHSIICPVMLARSALLPPLGCHMLHELAAAPDARTMHCR